MSGSVWRTWLLEVSVYHETFCFTSFNIVICGLFLVAFFFLNVKLPLKLVSVEIWCHAFYLCFFLSIGAGFGELRNDNDANCTYEGDNNVLLQQTSNWLVSVWNRKSKMSAKHPMGTVDYIDNSDHILKHSWKTSPLNLTSRDQGKSGMTCFSNIVFLFCVDYYMI